MAAFVARPTAMNAKLATTSPSVYSAPSTQPGSPASTRETSTMLSVPVLTKR